MLQVTPELNSAGLAVQDERNHEISLADVFRKLRTRIALIFACIAVAVAMAGAYVYTATPLYLAKAQILIDPKLPQLLKEQPNEIVVSLDNAQLESQMAVLRSEKIAQTVIDKLKLDERPEFTDVRPGLLETLLVATRIRQPPQPMSEFERQREIMNKFLSDIDVRRVGLSYALDISVTSENPALASDIANAIIEAYINDQLEAKSRAMRQGGEWLEQRIEAIRAKLNAAAIAVKEFRASHDYRVLPKAGAEKETVTIEELEATATTYAKLYDSALQAYTNAVLGQSYPVADARLITAATRPLTKVSPKSVLIMSFAVLIGLSLGVVIALLTGPENSRA
jgi:uncharacterized protein involved in exopolysaccharide biosynthesis